MSPCENAIAASNAGVVNQLSPTAGRFPAQPLLFSEDALSYISLRHAQLDRNQTAGRCFPGSAANTLYPIPRVACVSRLIGNSDSTGKAI
jgi:hypothetical protein